MKKNNKQPIWPTIVRGIYGRCPCCGKGLMFASYLKLVEKCSVCGEKLGHIRADDGPAWLTIILVGHILAPFVLYLPPDNEWSDWQVMAALVASTLVMTCMLLPRCKGVFISFIWRAKCAGSEV